MTKIYKITAVPTAYSLVERSIKQAPKYSASLANAVGTAVILDFSFEWNLN